MKFLKMHGAGNDFIVVNNLDKSMMFSQKKIAQLCDRHKGIGADGLILVEPSNEDAAFMNYYNADGTIAQMCGNGMRCLAKYVTDRQIVKKTQFTVASRAGRIGIELLKRTPAESTIRVDMGNVVFSAQKIPVISKKEEVIGAHFDWDGVTYSYGCASMGNPHMVVLTGDFDQTPIEAIGPYYEKHAMFPENCNISFAEVKDTNHIRMDTWERGDGRTLACGTGTCATVAVLHRLGRVDTAVEAQLSGGILSVELDGSHVWMTGPAQTVYEGSVDVEALQ
ncbi:diaminopimelate epimerase [Pseudoramibacter alactolyticus]|jgi:diaminopimelate epimerase|uniref:diaminopimelate epimerase n=1 Tax=Pseudoramibacter alactolyticus TaxID=113287 RepID=UPI00235484CF|nr:diaminopimelate epimerase [Pseudoramibacter alactolyticus]MBM6967830.1 diaminopimelate epimerase [Pseudoramibacter alactolyticus]